MQVRCVYYSGDTDPSLVFVPGFFTQPLVAGSPIDKSWETQLQAVCQRRHWNAYLVDWPAGNIFDISLFGGGNVASSTIQSAIQSWCSACNRADQISAILTDHFRGVSTPVHLVGHSLGGRIALCVAESLNSDTHLTSVTALAPAVSAQEVDLDKVAHTSRRLPAIYYSSRDKVLSTIFPFGQQADTLLSLGSFSTHQPLNLLKRISQAVKARSTNPALGSVGVPPKYRHLFKSEDTRLRHAKYAPSLGRFLRHIPN